jgi:RNA polymerase sigma-70 factor (ECF subfamily)
MERNICRYSEFKSVYNDNYSRLCVYAVGIVNDDAVAEDIVQEFFIKLWQNRKSTTISDSLKSYCYQSVKNRCISHLRKQKFNTEYIESQNDIGINIFQNNSLEYKELKLAFDNCLNSIPPRCKQIFTLSRLEDFSQKKISENLGISINTIKVQMGRALALLQNCIKSNYDLS